MSMYALIDANNFFVSCERVFQPKLEGKPVIVLSNNDGVAVSRSNEVKRLGIAMGAPYFSFKHLIKEHGIFVFSSNFDLYNDMAHRVRMELRRLLGDIEVYSIDEAFVTLKESDHIQLQEIGHVIKSSILQTTGIPVSIGIGVTKTLAKAANELAKKRDGVFVVNEENIASILNNMPVEEIWGIGGGWTKRLAEIGIKTAEQLRLADFHTMKKKFGSPLAKTILELRGETYLGIEEESEQKQIISSRSFGRLVEEYSDLRQALCFHISKACQKMRSQDLHTHGILVAIYGCPKGQFGKYCHSLVENFPFPIQDTSAILKYAVNLLKRLYKPHWIYKKLGITLLELIPNRSIQLDLFNVTSANSGILMETVDDINIRLGRGTLRYALEGFDHPWAMRSNSRTPFYTTSWTELPTTKN